MTGKLNSQELRPVKWRQRMARKLVFGRCQTLQGGRIQLRDADGLWTLGDSAVGAPEVQIEVRDAALYGRLMRGGGLGASESLLDGEWTCSDLPQLIRLLVANMDLLDGFDGGLARLRKGLERVGHWLRRNTLQRSKSNISQHYDLGNDFFSLFLDPTMNYSSAIFSELPSSGAPESLQRAQLRKMDQLCQMLQLKPQDHLLEIGTGWGSMACFAAKHCGCRVTTTTISREQYDWARQRVSAEGLEDRVTVLERDYRLLEGSYDKIVSVEMIEAVGDQFYDTFFAKCRSLLKPEGLLLLQAITIVDQRYEKHLRSVDFICKYIFPGGSLPCISRLIGSAAQAAEMRAVRMNDYAAHYAETLRRWRQRFWDKIDDIRNLGYDERFVRMWDYYLAYCEAAFDQRQINLVHLLFASRESRFDTTQAPVRDGEAGIAGWLAGEGPLSPSTIHGEVVSRKTNGF